MTSRTLDSLSLQIILDSLSLQTILDSLSLQTILEQLVCPNIPHLPAAFHLELRTLCRYLILRRHILDMDTACTEWMTEHGPHIQMVILPTIVYCALQSLGQRYLCEYHHLIHEHCHSLPTQLQYLLLRPYLPLPLVIHYLVNQYWPFGSSIDYSGGEGQFQSDLYEQFERLNFFLDIFILAGTVIHLLDFATAWSKIFFRIAFEKLPFGLHVKRLPSDLNLAELLFHLAVCTIYFSGIRRHSWQAIWDIMLWAPVLIIYLIHRHEITNSVPLIIYNHAHLSHQARLSTPSSPQGPEELRKKDVQKPIDLPPAFGSLAPHEDSPALLEHPRLHTLRPNIARALDLIPPTQNISPSETSTPLHDQSENSVAPSLAPSNIDAAPVPSQDYHFLATILDTSSDSTPRDEQMSDLELLSYLYETHAAASKSTELHKGLQLLLDNSHYFPGSGPHGRVLASTFASLSRHESVAGEPEVLRTDSVQSRQFSEEAFGFLLSLVRAASLCTVRRACAIRTLEDGAVESTNEYNREIDLISELRSELAEMKGLKEKAQDLVSLQEKAIRDKDVEIAKWKSRFHKVYKALESVYS
ncbi:hypothetical protein EG328_004046 [Venturia inaequalis]|uniref:Uncharacterized protein n=1 Tax=Venturia inaequalis TaxID=5025 RepID=A0A8H3YYZ6_VENIN|nr:hypothetical protein EG328_004046 [Venturia inaequalis]